MGAAAIPAVAALGTIAGAANSATSKGGGEKVENKDKAGLLEYTKTAASLAGGIADLAKPLPARQIVSPGGSTPSFQQSPTVAQSLSGFNGASPGSPQVTVPQMQNLQTLLAAFGKQGN
jgi:hypothetical protein